jgi:hypothetical protein
MFHVALQTSCSRHVVGSACIPAFTFSDLDETPHLTLKTSRRTIRYLSRCAEHLFATGIALRPHRQMTFVPHPQRALLVHQPASCQSACPATRIERCLRVAKIQADKVPRRGARARPSISALGSSGCLVLRACRSRYSHNDVVPVSRSSEYVDYSVCSNLEVTW